MEWIQQAHPVESVVEWGAPIIVAAAAAWAIAVIGLPVTATIAAGAAAFAAGMAAMRVAGSVAPPIDASFEPAELAPADHDNELLLDDPLVEVEADSRVVRLFERLDPTPGELVLQISDYLIEQGRAPPVAGDTVPNYPIDASDALHAALANIRSTLR